MTEKLYCNIEKHSQSGQELSVNGVLDKLGLSRSGYYEFIGRTPSKSLLKRDKIMDEILAIYDKSNQIFGAPKIHRELIKKGIFISERTVTNYMKRLNIKACWVKKCTHNYPEQDEILQLKNILEQRFNPENPNEFWCTDITYIPTLNGFVYLTCIMELYSRKIISWELSDSLYTQNVVDALEKALSLG